MAVGLKRIVDKSALIVHFLTLFGARSMFFFLLRATWAISAVLESGNPAK